MPPSRPTYNQSFRKAWLTLPELKGWLKPSQREEKKAYCVYCKCDLIAKLTDLRRHAKSEKHKKAASPFIDVRQQTLSKWSAGCTTTAQETTSQAEGRLALVVAEHTSFLTIDHLSEACKKAFYDSIATKNLKLHRTKCRNIIVNVLAPHFRKILREDVGDSHYSILIDESTDITVTKLLGVVMRYFSKSLERIVSTHLGLVNLEDGCAQSIVNAIKQLLHSMKLNTNKLLGIGVDNASVNTGLNNGVYQLAKREFHLPCLVMVRCVCHSIQLAISHAAEESLPRNVDFMIKETYNWFSHSTKRQATYKALYETLNNGKQPLKLTRVCDTRWVSMEPAVVRILNQWEELKLHFEVVRSSEKCYTAEMLFNMYSDKVNKLYLIFLRSILQDVQQTVKVFQGENVDPTKLLADLTHLILATSKRVLTPSAKIDPLTQDISEYVDTRAYLGYQFETNCSMSNLPEESQCMLRYRCSAFVVKLCTELRSRLPDNFETLEKMSLFSVAECLRVVKEPIVDLAASFGYSAESIERIDIQWRQLTIVQWQETASTVKFWNEVCHYKDAAGINPYLDLCQLAISILSLPHSNAEVERLFSQLNLVKSKLRNRINIASVNAVLAIRCGMKRVGKSCDTFELPKEVVSQIGTMQVYKSEEEFELELSTSNCISTLFEED